MKTFGLFVNNVDEREMIARIQAESLGEAAEKMNCDIVPMGTVPTSGILAKLLPRWSLGELEGNNILIAEVQCIQNDEDLRRCFRELGYTV